MSRFLLIVYLMILLSPSSIGQGISILKKKEQISCTKALAILEKQFQVTFSYEVSLLKSRKTSVTFITDDLGSSLENILAPHQLTSREVADGFIVILPISSSPTQGKKNVVISGRIIDQQSKEVISYAGIQLLGTKQGVYSDEYGFFQLTVSARQVDTLLIRRMGYSPVKVAVSSFVDSISKVIPLSPLASTLEDVIITKEKIPPITLGGEKGEITIIPREFTALPGWGEPDILRAAQQLPGINSSNESAGQLHIRGGTPDQNLLMWDHIPIYHLSHFFGMYSPFNPYISQKVEVYRGDYGVQYGGRVAGVIDITGRPDTLGLLKAGVGANLLHAHGFLEVPTSKKSVLLLSIRKSYTDWLESSFYRKLFDRVFQDGRLREQKYDQQESLDEPGYEVEFNPRFNFEDINAKWVFFPTENDKFSLSFYQGSDNLNSDYLEGTEDIVWWQSFNDISLSNNGLSMSLEHSWHNNQQTALRFLHSNYRNEQYLEDRSPIEESERYLQFKENMMEENKISLSHMLTLSKHTFTGGVDFSQNDVNYKWEFFYPVDESEGDSATIVNQVFSPYLQHEFKNEKWYIRSGLRATSINTQNRNYWEPRLSLSYFLLPSLRMKFSVGRFVQYTYQIVDYNELSVGENIWVSTEGDLLPVVSSNHLSLSAFWNKDDWQVELSVYNRKADNILASFVRLQEEDRYLQDDDFFSTGNSHMRGLDFWLKKKWEKYQSWFSYSLGRVSYEFPEIEDIPGEVPAPHDIRHISNWTHVYSSRHWDFSAQLSYSSGRPYTPIFLRRYPSEGDPNPLDLLSEPLEEPVRLETYNNNIGRESGEFFSRRLPATFRMDIAANYTALFGKVRPVKAKFGCSIFNLLNRTNYFDISYRIEVPLEDELEEGEIQLPQLEETRKKMLGFTPNLFLRLEW